MGEHWYLGTADAVWQNLYSIERERPRWVIVLAGDHIYKMDYGKMLDVHIARGARLTVAAIEVPLADVAPLRGAGGGRRTARVVGFREKPETAPAAPWNPGCCLGLDGHLHLRHRRAGARAAARRRGRLDPRLRQATSSRGWSAAGERVFAYLFWDENKKESQYWRDVGTIDAYYEASMDLIQVDPVFNLYDPDWPMRTYQPQLPPAKFVFAEDGRRGVATQSIVSMGCIVSGSEVRRSILCPNVRIHSFCDVEDSILLPDAVVRPPRPASAAPSSTAAWWCPGARSSATTPPRTAAATPSPRAAWWWSPPARSASSIPISDMRHSRGVHR